MIASPMMRLEATAAAIVGDQLWACARFGVHVLVVATASARRAKEGSEGEGGGGVTGDGGSKDRSGVSLQRRYMLGV